jgi:hypothetical protein
MLISKPNTSPRDCKKYLVCNDVGARRARLLGHDFQFVCSSGRRSAMRRGAAGAASVASGAAASVASAVAWKPFPVMAAGRRRRATGPSYTYGESSGTA